MHIALALAVTVFDEEIAYRNSSERTVSMNAPQPNPGNESLQPDELRKELASILCAGLKRILPETSSDLSSNSRDSLVDFSPLKSGIARRKLRSR